MATRPEPASATTRCVVCQEDIRQGARLCTHCDSAQDWTRHLARWSTLAAAVLGVGSLVSAAYSLWKLVPSPAKIEAVTLSCQHDSVSLALVNVGDKPGAVRSVSLQVKSATESKGPIPLSALRGDENPIIEAGKSATLSYVNRVANARSPFPRPPGGSCQYVLSIGAVDFRAGNVPFTTQCDCP
jgi:hypothetical protein